MSVARTTSTMDEHQPSWQRKREQRVQQQPQQTRRSQLSPDCERNPRNDASCAGKLDQRYDQRVPTRFPYQQPQKQDEAHTAYTAPSKNELSCSEVTQGKGLACGRATRDDWNTVCDPGAGSSEVNEQPPMARLASSLRRAASLNSVTLGGLKSEIRDDEAQVMPGLWTRWSTPLFT